MSPRVGSTVARERQPWRARRLPVYWIPAVLGPVGETAVIRSIGPRDSAPLAPQLTALPPFDVFHDLRWIAVYHDSWWLLALELVAMVVLRSAYTAWLLQTVWPDERRPSLPRAALRAAAFYAIVAALLLPWAAFQFGAQITHLSYLFFVGLPPALFIVLATHRGAFAQASGRVFRWRPTAVSLAWAAVSFLWLTAAGAAISVTPGPVALLVAGAAGTLNAEAVANVARGVARAREEPPFRRDWVVPASLALVFGAALGGAALGFWGLATRTGPGGEGEAVIPSRGRGRPVLVASGFNSSWRSSPTFRPPPGFVAWPFSYRGMAGRRRIRPYTPGDTLRSLTTSARQMRREVQALHEAYGRPVAIVAESEAALVARTYLTTMYDASTRAVDHVVLLEIPVGRSSVTFPPPGAQGWGVGTGWVLRGIAVLARSIGPLRVSADAPFFRDVAECGGLLRAVVDARPPPGVEQVSIAALADATVLKSPVSLAGTPEFIVASAHGGLITDPDVRDLISRALTGRIPSTADGLEPLENAITALSVPWQAPSLVRGLADERQC